ncbi:hypothetical protein SOPP22_06155 [Shewanella sp. OPT22]|uniref:LPS translocon maturation chaperone LptM n=1 Tax=Parashewanella hymeniacidonis TaxID=2807618 RepID=UPI0010217B27|nr:lipoprotein [Parashewanella hymeniacidonis]MBM7071222.1 lipoprotein [Parashewanella hymeniacidonis]RYV03054.1 hypothetical protein SOPP22_06155 [Shewanella sp. OPT22]
MNKTIIFLSLVMLLSACGQKGPLYLEPKADSNQPKTEKTKPTPKKKVASDEKSDKEQNQN